MANINLSLTLVAVGVILLALWGHLKSRNKKPRQGGAE